MIGELGDLTHIGDAGVAVAVLIVVVIGFWAIRGIALAWFGYASERSKEAHALELKRIESQQAQEIAESAANRAIADALTQLKKVIESQTNRQDLIEATTNSLITSSKQLAAVVVTLTENMQGRAEVVDQKLAEIHTGVQNVPAAVWEQGDPKLDGVLTALNAMERRLLDKIAPGADVARAVIREEFGDLIGRIRLIVDYLERDQDRQTSETDKIASDYLNKSEFIPLPVRPGAESCELSQMRQQADGAPAADTQKDDPAGDPVGDQVSDEKPPETPKPGEHV